MLAAFAFVYQYMKRGERPCRYSIKLKAAARARGPSRRHGYCRGLFNEYPSYLKFLDINIPIRHRAAVVLQKQRAAGDRAVEDSAGSSARQNDVVMYHDAVLQECHTRALDNFVALKAWRAEIDVVGLPLKRGQACVGKGRVHAVNRGAVAVGGRLDAIGIEHLNFVAAMHINAAIAFSLPVRVRHVGLAELEVDVRVAELIFRNDIAATDS